MVTRVGDSRVEVLLPPGTSFKQQRELEAFVRYCVRRIELELGAMERWTMRLDPGYRSTVLTLHRSAVLEGSGRGPDAVLATWDAMCRIEAVLRERSSTGTVAKPGRARALSS